MKKKLITILSVLLVGVPLLAQNSHGNPFAHLGYEAKIATLTDFEEFHDFEDVVEIGQVLYDTKKREIVGFVGEKDYRIELIKDVISTSIDPHCEKYPWISPYAHCMNNPVRYIDPDGRDVWEINKDGYIEWKEESKQHRLYSLDADGNRTDNYVRVKDRSILDNLTGTDEIMSTTVGKGSANDLFKVFKFAADNTSSEWVIYKYDQDNTTNFTLGTRHHETNAGSPSLYGITATPDAKIHSHPNIATDRISELSSMGMDRNGNSVSGPKHDWYNVKSDIRTNGYQKTLSYVYFQNTTNLYHISGSGPAFIRKINNDYTRFFFGTLK